MRNSCGMGGYQSLLRTLGCQDTVSLFCRDLLSVGTLEVQGSKVGQLPLLLAVVGCILEPAIWLVD
uniref:Uncharacterized protein n=1 Tax=Arundo donax TaxID=35708 RepID=A0A0A9EUM1_ARUDO